MVQVVVVVVVEVVVLVEAAGVFAPPVAAPHFTTEADALALRLCAAPDP